MKRNKFVVTTAVVASLGLVAAACGSDDDADEPADTTAEEPADTTAEEPADEPADTTADEPADTGGEESAAEGPCPANVVVQTDWWPELEHGGTYQLIGPDGTTDAGNFTYSGPIADAYAVGGVETVEIRAGGDAVSFTPVDSLLATDDDIMFGYINMSDVIKGSGGPSPVVAVAKTLDGDPQMVMWDPDQNAVETPEDIAASNAQVLHFDGVAYIDYMIGVGYMTADQSNPSYGGAPDAWVAEGGNFFQQGFATNEVYKYENEIEWKDGAPAPVEFFTVADLGFDNYAATMAVRADRLEEFGPCLEVLVPAMQQAWVDYLADPTPVTDALIGVNETYDTYWQISEGLNTRGMELLEELEFGANSPDGTYCSFDPDRVQELYDILAPIYDEEGVTIADDPAATYDNSFCESAPGR
jgi:hypothetical protein